MSKEVTREEMRERYNNLVQTQDGYYAPRTKEEIAEEKRLDDAIRRLIENCDKTPTDVDKCKPFDTRPKVSKATAKMAVWSVWTEARRVLSDKDHSQTKHITELMAIKEKAIEMVDKIEAQCDKTSTDVDKCKPFYTGPGVSRAFVVNSARAMGVEPDALHICLEEAGVTVKDVELVIDDSGVYIKEGK